MTALGLGHRDGTATGSLPRSIHAMIAGVPGRASLLVAAALLAGAIASRASAQCADGRIAIAEGACCWEGQTWSGERCAGPPSCPERLVAEGDTCVPRVLPIVLPIAEPVVGPSAIEAEPRAEPERDAAATEVPEPPRATARAAAPPTDEDAERPAREPVMSMRHQLVGLGATFLFVGWTAAAITGSIFASFASFGGPNCRAQHGPWGWLPVLGAVIAGAAIDACSPPWESNITDWLIFGFAGAAQIIGVVMIAVGVVDRRPVPGRFQLTADGVTIRF